MKRVIKSIIFGNKFLFRFFCRYFWRPKRPSTNFFIKEYAEASSNRETFFVQIGSNDGINNDPIYRIVCAYGWKGLLIEPQKKVFEEQLKKNYLNISGLLFENVAIAPKSGDRTLFKVAFSDARWATGLSSLRKANLEKAVANGYIEKCALAAGERLPKDPNLWISEETVMCFTLEEILKKNHISSVDCLVIDTEGYDYEILKAVDIGEIKPNLICYEHKHLSDSEQSELVSILEGFHYSVFSNEGDTVAHRNGGGED